jgi:hypothetical protein
MNPDPLAIVTCSYGPDAERCRRLCRSIDRFVPECVDHCLIVPQRDYPLFRDLARGRRRVCTTEEVVPGGFKRVPLTEKWWLARDGWPVRGWIMQQITKLSANHAVEAEQILFADSDIEFIRPLDTSLLCREQHLRLHRVPGAAHEGRHLLWHHRAGALLGLAPRYFGSDYIGQLITWRRSRLIDLQHHLEEVAGSPWYRPIARSLHFSEYILYGVFVEQILGEERNGHFYCADDICHCCWFAADTERLRSGTARVSDRAQAILFQSNLGLALDEEAELLGNARRQINPQPLTGN